LIEGETKRETPIPHAREREKERERKRVIKDKSSDV
jgi:hypothetical protein